MGESITNLLIDILPYPDDAMKTTDKDLATDILSIGCCGAYCKTCPPLLECYCKGCKLGYDSGERDITVAKCKMKVCCFKEKHLATCADCPEYEQCRIIRDFQSKNGYKYKKYTQSLEFIRTFGYEKFLQRSNKWKRAYGRLD